ncbi:MAG: mRNA splicing protein prp18 [Bathelium mastoideum]|nr:MAG: mRNA splicing protein prp18 [Bathelium mastoideum]
MDFASLMSAQIAKGKAPPASSGSGPKKYLKRSEVEAQREAKYRAEQEALEREKEERYERKRKLEEEEAARDREREEKRRRMAEESKMRREEEEAHEERKRRRRLGLPDIVSEENSAESTPVPEQEEITDEELVVKLREMQQPATLFGEDHEQRLRRYLKLKKPTQVMSRGPIPTTLEMVPEKDMKVDGKLPKTEAARSHLFRQLASYFTMVFTEWDLALRQRTEEVKESYQGKAAYNAMVQAKENMKPLFRKMEKGEIDDGVLEPVVEIVKAAQERRYVDANDGYLRLSIGKAAWPIGVTMVGIHERSAREKLHESDKGAAHIMSDETTRKYLQSIKRCLSFAQTRWPPDDQLQLMG